MLLCLPRIDLHTHRDIITAVTLAGASGAVHQKRKAEMRQTYFIRHGKAAKTKNGQHEMERPLTEEGARQCARLDLAIGQVRFGLVLSSPADRAITTAYLVTTAERDHIRVLRELYTDPRDGGLSAEFDRLFNLPHLGYAPVQKYLNEPGGDAVMQWAQEAWGACSHAIQDAGDPDVVAIFGHAVCQPAIAMIQCGGKRDLVERIANINLGECGGFIVRSNEHGVPTTVEMIDI